MLLPKNSPPNHIPLTSEFSGNAHSCWRFFANFSCANAQQVNGLPFSGQMPQKSSRTSSVVAHQTFFQCAFWHISSTTASWQNTRLLTVIGVSLAIRLSSHLRISKTCTEAASLSLVIKKHSAKVHCTYIATHSHLAFPNTWQPTQKTCTANAHCASVAIMACYWGVINKYIYWNRMKLFVRRCPSPVKCMFIKPLLNERINMGWPVPHFKIQLTCHVFCREKSEGEKYGE